MSKSFTVTPYVERYEAMLLGTFELNLMISSKIFIPKYLVIPYFQLKL